MGEGGSVCDGSVVLQLSRAECLTCPGFDDNQDVIALAESLLRSARSKNIDAHVPFTREVLRAT